MAGFLNIRFKGQPYLFVGRRLEDGGAITTWEEFSAMIPGYAHVKDGKVWRYHQIIGTIADIEVESPAATEGGPAPHRATPPAVPPSTAAGVA
jgi:hypothetical protein